MYFLTYAILYLFSLLPMRLLYLISDGIYILVYYLFGYRKEVVMQNLEIAFPEKTKAERKKIAKQFYHNFIDSFIESIKLISASDAFFQKRFTGNWEVINECSKTGRSAQLHLGHTFNWEWGNYVGGTKLHHKYMAVYMPLQNAAVDRLFKKIRGRSGTILIPATPPNVFRTEFVKYRKAQSVLALVADQSPSDPSKAYWLNFFQRPTAFVTG